MAKIGLGLQGGGGLGAYQLGVIEALSEQRLSPLVVSGVSIGVVNNADVFCAPCQRNLFKRLRTIWRDFSRSRISFGGLPLDDLIAALGNPAMYLPGVDYPFVWQWADAGGSGG